jgi:hypothetical protein
MCHSILLIIHVLGSKTKDKKGLMSYKIENETLAMKKHCEGKHSNIWKVYFSEISLQHCTKTNPFEKQNSKT